MIMADILFWIAVAIGLMATFIAHWLAAQALLPQAVARSAEAYARRPIACCAFGFAITVPVVGLLLAAVQNLPNPLLKALAVLLVSVILVLSFIGSAGLAKRIGEGLPSPVADSERPWRPVMRGGLVLSLVFIAPVIGWFVLMPLTFMSGFGAWLLGRRIDA